MNHETSRGLAPPVRPGISRSTSANDATGRESAVGNHRPSLSRNSSSLQKVWTRLTRPRTRFQILSDLHLEVGQQYNNYEIPSCAPYLVLAGDTGRLADYAGYLAFLTRHAQYYELIFLVLGNHEFYSMTYHEGLRAAEKLQAEPDLDGKLILLHRGSHHIKTAGITVIGCSLWSRIDEAEASAVTMWINDFKRISGWSVATHNEAHHRDLEWLKGEVESAQKSVSANESNRILVVTHYPPCKDGSSDPRHASSGYGSAFASDILEDSRWDGISTWIFGHTHYTTNFVRNSIQFTANQRGYILDPSQEAAIHKSRKRDHRFDIVRTISI